MIHLHSADLFARIRKVNRNMVIYDKAVNGSRGGISDIKLDLYLVVCRSCNWNTQYLVRSEELDISDSITKCPVCHMKSIECRPIPLPQGGRSRRSTSDTLALTGVANRNKIRHKASWVYEQLSYYLEIMIVKGLLDMDRRE
jgi:hypothetical protein